MPATSLITQKSHRNHAQIALQTGATARCAAKVVQGVRADKNDAHTMRVSKNRVCVASTFRVSMIMQIIVSLAALGAGLYVILSPHHADEKKWGHGTVGSVIGYWLRP
jgi:hypothetical protein